MDRRNFIQRFSLGTGALATGSFHTIHQSFKGQVDADPDNPRISADLVIAGGGLGGCAAAFSALRNGLSVVLTEETDWVGGQLTSQGVPPDEHLWIETHGSTQLYRDFRNAIRDYYRKNYPLRDEARAKEFLNPGDGTVSRLCHEPRVALAVLLDMMAPYRSSRKLLLLLQHKIVHAEVQGNKVMSLVAKNLLTNQSTRLTAPYFVDATELGDLLPLTGTEYVTGTESKAQTNELHAPEKANPVNNQAFTVCFAMDYLPGEDHTIEKPGDYDFWKNFTPKMNPPWSGPLLDLMYSNPRTLEPKVLGFNPEGKPTGDALNLWNYRRIINKQNFEQGFYRSDITLINWPQNDYLLGDIVEASEAEFKRHVENGKQLSLSLLYWLQTEAPGGQEGRGWPGLRLREDVMGTADGLAKYPYVRESRRIKALFTVLEEHVGADNRAMVAEGKTGRSAADFYDTVGTGYYHIDLHPSSDGDNYIDFKSLPFQIPLGALLPVRMDNLLPANKNIGTTHLSNGCYRLHPVEWSIGEAVGMLVSFVTRGELLPREVRQNPGHLTDFQSFIRSQGIDTHWPEG